MILYQNMAFMSDPFFHRLHNHFNNFSYGIITVGSMEQNPGSNKLFFGPSGCERDKHQSSCNVDPWESVKERGLWFEDGDIVHCHT